MIRLEARMLARVGEFVLRAEITAEAGEVVAVLGPNGAGKSTLLRTIAGLVPLSGGSVSLGGRLLEHPERGIRLRPEERRLGVVFQDDRLFPHLTVSENVAFGPRAQGMTDSRAVADHWIGKLGMEHLATRQPSSLSGGEARRVALARALASSPDLLLLDEPLAASDLEAAAELRRLLRLHIRDADHPVILITHDPLDAATLSDRIIVIEDGVITQSGTLRQVTEQPRSDWSARLGGLNLFRGTASGTKVDLEGGGSITSATPANGAVWVTVHPRAVALFVERPEGSPRNTWSGRVQAMESWRDRVRVSVTGALPIVAEVTPAAVHELGLVEGDPVWVSVKATEISIYRV